LCYCFYSLFFAILSYPLGKLSDQKGPEKIFIFGLFVFALVYGIFAAASDWTILLVGLFLYGIFSAATDGVGKALVVGLAPKEQKATAIGLFVGCSGIATLAASVLCGYLWEDFGSAWTFGLSAGLALVCAISLFIFANHREANSAVNPVK
jgi:MFS family permease